MQNNTTAQLWNDISEAQSEEINGGFFDTNVFVRKRSVVIVNQESGTAVVGLVFGNANVSSGNAAFVFSSVS
jgi:hypothetical protein